MQPPTPLPRRFPPKAQSPVSLSRAPPPPLSRAPISTQELLQEPQKQHHLRSMSIPTPSLNSLQLRPKNLNLNCLGNYQRKKTHLELGINFKRLTMCAWRYSVNF